MLNAIAVLRQQLKNMMMTLDEPVDADGWCKLFSRGEVA
jgi:hypothetical protein